MPGKRPTAETKHLRSEGLRTAGCIVQVVPIAFEGFPFSTLGMNEQKRTLRALLAWVPRVAGAAVMLALIGALAWIFLPPGGWSLPAGGALAGAVIGWKKGPSPKAGRMGSVLNTVVGGAALGLLVVFFYQSQCTPVPKEPGGQETEREMLTSGSRWGATL